MSKKTVCYVYLRRGPLMSMPSVEAILFYLSNDSKRTIEICRRQPQQQKKEHSIKGFYSTFVSS